ncbi:DUF4178 domain-containing protein [Ruegeria arenilitoris]|uniref:DUF4178 domain-containing protein n=1 Tax=Ruegeria arenilitoris TaxID=1173585 RepID=UPI00147AD8A3|nr:DUF4178 domain-containing protein [Ruegeria arenilitoris]
MTRNPELLSINCTCCGAGLDVLGGSRVVVQVCPYCGSELDAQDNYRILRQFTGLKRPVTPFSLDQKGTLYGVEFTIIGLMERQERWAGRLYSWVDHQLFSPTHGYAWLTLDSDHLIFTRRYRGSAWMSEQWVETAEHPPTVTTEHGRFKYYETATSSVTYVEGEFTWRPRVGEKTTTISAMSDDAMLDFSTTGSEREIYRSVYVPKAQAEAAFGVEMDLKPYRVHALQPLVKGPNYEFLRNAAFVFGAVCLIMAFVLTTRTGYPVLRNFNVDFRSLPVEIPIPLQADSQLTRISFLGDVRNSWAYLDLELRDPTGEPVFEAGRMIEYYTGRDSDGTWGEGTQRASLTFRPEQTGDYTLVMDVPEQGVWNDRSADRVPSRPFSNLRVDVTSGLSSGLWALVLAGAFGLLFLFQFGRKHLHQRARWSGTDWVDEE